MCGFLNTLFLFVTIGREFPTQPVPETVDRYGDPLPGNASGRLGSIRFRKGMQWSKVAFLAQGTSLISLGQDRHITILDVPSGKPIRIASQLRDTPTEWFVLSPDQKTIACLQRQDLRRLTEREIRLGKRAMLRVFDLTGKMLCEM